MMIPAAMLVLAQALSPAAQAFVHDATDRLIAGEDLAPDFPVRLQALARGRAMEEHVHLVDSVEEAVAVVAG